jgi:hypothetical protein
MLKSSIYRHVRFITSGQPVDKHHVGVVVIYCIITAGLVIRKREVFFQFQIIKVEILFV